MIVLLSILVLEEDEEKKEKQKPRMIVNLKKQWKKVILIVILSLTLISVVLGLFTSIAWLEAFRIVFGSVYVLLLPGFIISYIFFPKTKEFDSGEKEKGAIDWIERIALSFALSIAIVPLAVFYLNLIGVKINILNSFLTIFGILVVSGVVLKIRLKKNQ